MLMGLQASGKSTWAKQFVKENQSYKRICRDDYRHMLSSYTFNNKNEELVECCIRNSILLLLNKNYNIVIDEMHLNKDNLVKQLVKEIEKIKD
jgi:predicted kinase